MTESTKSVGGGIWTGSGLSIGVWPSVIAEGSEGGLQEGDGVWLESDPRLPSEKRRPRGSRRSSPLGGRFERVAAPLLERVLSWGRWRSSRNCADCISRAAGGHAADGPSGGCGSEPGRRGYSGFGHAPVVPGSQSWTALAEVLQEVLWTLGGAGRASDGQPVEGVQDLSQEQPRPTQAGARRKRSPEHSAKAGRTTATWPSWPSRNPPTGRADASRAIAPRPRLSPGKTLDNFNFSRQPELSEPLVRFLATAGDWIDNGHNIVVLGPPYTGKGHLAAGIGLAPRRAWLPRPRRSSHRCLVLYQRRGFVYS